jgi:phage shock protein PspC (stress-responsive transcriptional regulator)
MSKKFHLSSTDKKLGGVCGGIAEHLGVDATIVRVAFLIFALCGSLGFWVYILLWLLGPKA